MKKTARSRKRREERGNRRIVPKSFADVREAVDILGTKNEAPSKLERVLPELHLPMSRGASPLARHHVVAPKKMQQVGVAKFR
jgi:hypothetical protein